MYASMKGKTGDLNFIALRPCNTFGRKSETGFIVEYLITTMLRGANVYLGTPNSRRDFMYLDDHIDAYLMAMKHKDRGLEVLNAGTGDAVSIKELALQIAELIGYKGKILNGYPPGYPRRPAFADPEYLSLNSRKIKDSLGWRPKHSLAQGLEETIGYWKKRLRHPK